MSFNALKRRLFSVEIHPLTRIGKALVTIPEEYKTFLVQKPEIVDIYAPNLKLILHSDAVTGPDTPRDKLLEITGRAEIFRTIERMKMLLKWGHFYWRLSDLSALKLDPIRVIRPALESDARAKSSVEMKIYWQLKVRRGGPGLPSILFIDGEDTKMSVKSVLQVQLQRLRLIDPPVVPPSRPDAVLYSGICRYVFDTHSGFCTEVHVERVEPKISAIDWKWRRGKVKFSGA